MSNNKAGALEEREYLLLKERLLKKLKGALDSFVVEENALNPSIQTTDILYAQMEVLLDVAASAALATEETSRGDFIDTSIDAFDSMVEVLVEDQLKEGSVDVEAILNDPGNKGSTLN